MTKHKLKHNDQKADKEALKTAVINDAILTAVAHNPNATNKAIGRHVRDTGLIGNENQIYVKLRKSDYLTREIDAIRAHNRETLERTVVPLALSVTHKALKSKDIPLKDKQPWASMALKQGMGSEPGESTAPSMINIDKMQVIIQQALDE